MFSKQHLIKAATLLELLIVLAASSIVFASAAKCYEIVFKQTVLIKGILNAVEEVHQLHYLLERDIFKAKSILKESDKSMVFQNDSVTTHYQFNQEYILRKQAARSDTFHIKASDVELKIIDLFPGSQLIDRVQFKADFLAKKENFLFKKNYSAETLLNLSSED